MNIQTSSGAFLVRGQESPEPGQRPEPATSVSLVERSSDPKKVGSAEDSVRTPVEQKQEKAAPDDVQEAVQAMNDRLLQHPPMEARYEIDDRTKRIVVKIVNQDSGAVLRQFPAEAALRLAAALAESAPSAPPQLVDETA